MKSSLLTTAGCLAVVIFATATASAQTYQSNNWDGYRSGVPDWSSQYSAHSNQHSYANPQGNAYAQPYGNGYTRPGDGSYNTPQHGSYNAPHGNPYGAAHGESYGSYYQTPPPGSNYSTASGPAAQPQPSVLGPQHRPDAMHPGYGSVADTYDGSCDVGGDCAPCQRRPVQWMVSADVLFWTRTRGNTYPLLKVPSAVPPPAFSHEGVALDVADFSFGTEPGWRIGASRMICDGWGLEVGFLGMTDGWEYGTYQHGILELQGPGWKLGSDPTLPHPTAVGFRVTNTSEFYSGELNLVRGICDWATLRMGVRYIEFNDRLEVDELYTPLYNLLISTTDNNLIGTQLGADFKLFEWGGCAPACYDGGCGVEGACGPGGGYAGGYGGGGLGHGLGRGGLHGAIAGSGGGCRFRVNAMFNFGVFYNYIEHDPYSSFIGPPLVSEANQVALLGEVGLTAKYRLTDHVAIRGGYHIFSLHGVALAPDQIRTSDVVTEMTHTEVSSLIAHGATLGLEVFW